MRDSSVLIVGTGAMACLFAARLAPQAHVTMLGSWPEGLATLSRHGVRLEPEGAAAGVHVRATSEPGQCRDARLALVLVKSWQTGRAAAQLGACLAKDGVAVTLQNGLGNLEQLREVLGPERVALGTTTLGATLMGPGRVRAGGEGPVWLADHPRMAPLVALLEESGFDVRRAGDLPSLVWGKLAVSAAINPVTAVLRIDNGRVAEQPEARALAVAAATEVASVAAAHGVRLPFDAAEAVLEVARRTGRNRSSMFQDILRGAPTEADAICGMVVHKGEECGVPTPVSLALWQILTVLAGEADTQA